jgi:hypothetical protein
MFRSTLARRWVLTCLPVVAVFAPPIWSQVLARAEFAKFHRAALEEIVRKPDLDPEAVARVSKRLEPGRLNRHWDGDVAASRLTEAQKRGDFGLKLDNKTNLFELHRTAPAVLHLDPSQLDLSQQTSLEFVGSLSSVIRRMSILDQLGPGGSSVIETDRLDAYLKNTMNVEDHEQVAKSFDSKFRVEVKTLQEPTTLWRIYGGGSGPVGRYYFCCLLAGVADGPYLWIDGSGLATPPGNLRQHLAGVTVPAGTVMLVGTVADNFAGKFGHMAKGGNTQIFIPRVHGFPFDEYRKLAESSRIGEPASPASRPAGRETLRSEIIVQSDDRILRFQGAEPVRFP